MICPGDTTDAVRELLTTVPGATHVTVLPGVAVEPPGDVVEADLARECADEVLHRLRELGIEATGGITLTALDTTLSDAADRADEEAPGEPDDAIVWDEVIGRTGADSRLTVSYQVFLAIACLLAAVGVITNSPVTVVGAMVLGPEFGPLAAVAVGLVLRKGELVRRGAIALAIEFPVAIGITALAALAMDLTGLLTVDSVLRADQLDFIYQIGPFSLIVALLAGAAVAAVEGQFGRAGESALQLFINMIGIVIAASVVLLISRRSGRTGGPERSPRRLRHDTQASPARRTH